MKLQTAYIGLVAALSGATAQQQFCTDEYDKFIGYAGQREETIGNSVILDRRGGENCPCSYANIQCSTKIDGEEVNCRDIVINGTEATLGGVANYPKLKVDYSMDICNYNDYDMTFKRAKDSTEPSSFLKFWYPDPQDGKVYIEDKRYCDDAGCTSSTETTTSTIKKKSCLSASKSSTEIQTTYSNFYLQAKMQGPLIASGVENKFCYAYAFEPINLKYDYGDGPCHMHTEISCHVIDANKNKTGKTCEEKILEMNDSGNIQPFNSIIEAEACNRNDRPVYLQYNPSNFKFSNGPKAEPNPKDKYKKTRVKYDPKYDVVGGNAQPMSAGECQTFSLEKTIDPLLKNFHQINIQGMLYNNLNGNILFFRDKDCQSFSFESLPVIDPGAPSSVPSISTSPSVSMIPSGSPSLSMFPSSSPSASLMPSASPSESMKPSVSPSVSMIPSGSPSLSMFPSSSPTALPSESVQPSNRPSNVPSSVPSSLPSFIPSESSQPSKEPTSGPSSIPTSSPTESMKPSGVPSNIPSSVPSSLPSSNPSESSQPSKVPTSGPSSIPSSSPSASMKPSGVPSNIPSFVPSSLPSSNPSLSSKPSEVPSTGPSAIPSTTPSMSMKPSGTPSTSPSVSVAPSLAPSVSVAPSLQPSDSPSMNPSVSSAPSLLPSTAPSCSSSKKSAKSCKSTKTSAPTPSPTKPPGGPTPNGGGKGKGSAAPSKGSTAGAPSKGSTAGAPSKGDTAGVPSKGSTAGAPSKGSTRRLRK